MDKESVVLRTCKIRIDQICANLTRTQGYVNKSAANDIRASVKTLEYVNRDIAKLIEVKSHVTSSKA